jgi:SagB-type dehydrogenase family enzyme
LALPGADPDNRRIEAARRYHDGTAHTPESIRSSGHRLIWDIKPSPFKIYPELAALPLPREFPVPARDALRALTGGVEEPRALDRERLASVLFFSAGITRKQTYPGGGEVYFRAAPSTGALYQTEVYVVAGPAAGVPAGVHHFSPGDFSLRPLREGDLRAALAGAAADDLPGRAPATLVLTGLYWRNTWKYQARGYRHLFWDAGSMLANALSVAAALDLPARVLVGFADPQVNALLGLDAGVEGALALLALGAPGARPDPAPPAAPINPAVVPLSSRAIDEPVLRAAYRDSSLGTRAEVEGWRLEASIARPAAEETGAAAASMPLPPPRPAASRPLGETIFARGSTREFSGDRISAQQLSDSLYHATRGYPGDVPAGLVDLYVNIHAVDGIAPGAYAYDPGAHRLALVRAGDFRRESAFLCLEQALGGMSSATVFFLADLRRVLGPLGNRGYRAANLEAGLIGGRLYLAAYAEGFGASGLTFYDRAVVEFFSPHAAGKDAIFVTALGRSVRRAPRAPALLQIGGPGG